MGQREMIFGSNKKPVVVAKSFLQLLLSALNDFTLKILIVAAVFSIGLSTATAEEEHRSTAWIEGFSMIIAVIIVSLVTSTNDL
jgi:magnesium-transporting ATPase (P-type)